MFPSMFQRWTLANGDITWLVRSLVPRKHQGQNLSSLALESVPTPLTGLLSLEHKGEGEAATAPNSLHNPSRAPNSHQRAKSNINQRQATRCVTDLKP